MTTQEAFAVKAFHNNYGRPIIGWPDDFERLGRREVPQLAAADHAHRQSIR